MIAAYRGNPLTDRRPERAFCLSRSYNPAPGRFASMDDLVLKPGDTENANLYAYVDGNPVNLTDPTGHFSTSELGVSNGLAMVLDALFLPTTTLQGFAIRAVIGAAIYGVKELFIQHYYVAVADALDHLATVLSPVNNSWAGALKKQALGLRSDANSQRVLAVAQAIAPQFAGTHVSIVLGAVLGTSAYYDAKREVLDIENEASTAINRFTGLNIQLSIDPDVLVNKFLSRNLDPATDINLAADAISFGLAGNIPKAASSMGALLTHLKQQYPITVSGTFFNTSWSAHF